jgi:hypothetical protein
MTLEQSQLMAQLPLTQFASLYQLTLLLNARHQRCRQLA